MISQHKQFWKYIVISTALIIAPSAIYALTPSQVFEKAQDSIVVVYAYNGKGKKISQGSGVLISSTRVATNCHVLEDGANFEVVRNGINSSAILYAGDSVKDICLLDSKNSIGKSAILGSAINLKVGESVYAIGAPKGMELSLSDGIVSQLRGGNPPIIQTTAAISPGSSGGGLFNSTAQLVGLTTSTRIDSQSINFAMPVEYLIQITTDKRRSASKQRTLSDWVDRVAVLEKDEKWSELLEWGKLWAKAEPNSAMALENIGIAYSKLDEHKQAIIFYSRALAINPNYAHAYYNRGLSYAMLGDHNQAIGDWTQVIKINPKDAEAYKERAVGHYILKDYNQAVSDCTQAIKINPNYAHAYNNRGLSYAMLGDYNQAIVNHTQAIKINPNYTEAYIDRGFVHYFLKDYNQAINDWTQAIKINPKDANTYNARGNAYLLQANYKMATKDARKACELYNCELFQEMHKNRQIHD